MKKILAVTGITGVKSGGGFAKVLWENRENVESLFHGKVRALVRPTSDTSFIDMKSIMFDKIEGSLTDKAYLDMAFENVDTIVHIAGIRLSRYIVDSAVRCGVRRLIFVHTTGIYSKYKQAGQEYREIDEYVTKRCRENNINLTILRPTMIYGNTKDNNVSIFLRMVDKLPIMPVVDGARFPLQPVYYMDLSYAYYQVLMDEEHTQNRNFDLSGGEEILLRDMLVEMAKGINKKVRFVSIPFRFAYAGAWFIYLITNHKYDFREKVQRLVEPRVYSHQMAKEAFGYNPRSFREGITLEIEEYLEN